MDIDELFGRAAKASRPRSDDEEHPLTDTQIVARLVDCFASLNEEHEFTPGQILLHKFPSLAGTKNAERPAIYMRKLDTPISASDHSGAVENLYSNATTAVFDCIIAKVINGTLCEYFTQSKEYKPHPDFS